MFGRLKQSLVKAGARFWILFALIAILSIGGIFWRLGSSTQGFSGSEKALVQANYNTRTIISNPVNAPYKLLVKFAAKSFSNSRSGVRFVSALLGIVFLISFYFILRYWFGDFIAGLGSLLLLSTPLFILSARLVSPNIMYFAYILPAALYIWLISTHRRSALALVTLTIIVSLCLYTPGIVWLLAFSLIIGYRDLQTASKKAGSIAIFCAGLLAVLILLPLMWAIGSDWHIAQAIFLVPSHLESTINILKSLAWAPAGLIWHTRFSTELSVGQGAALGAAAVIFSIFGIYAMFTQAKREAIFIAGLLGFGLVLAGINNSIVLLSLAVSPLLIFSSAGMRHLYVEWKKVFPKNPIPNGLAVCLLVIVVAQSYAYGMNYAHRAWPHTASTKNIYVLK